MSTLAYAALVLGVQTGTPTVDLDALVFAPDAREIALLEELAVWIGDDGDFSTGPGLGEAIRLRRESFELFRSFHAEQARREQVLIMPYGAEIARMSERFGVDALLLASVVEAESNFDPQAVSPVGALGLMQVMPATGGGSVGELFEPRRNLEAGSKYLAWLLDEFQGDLELALAAYNAGPTAVRRFAGVPPYRETRRYVDKVLSIYLGHHRDRWQRSETTALLTQL